MSTFTVETKATKLGFEILENRKIILTMVGSNDLSHADEEIKGQMTLTEVQVTGQNFHHKGVSFVGTNPGAELTYVSHEVSENAVGTRVSVVQRSLDVPIEVTAYFQLYENTPVIRSWVSVKNIGSQPLGIEYVSSFALTGINQAGDLEGNYAQDNVIYIPNNSWTAEAQWKKYTLKDAGLEYWVDGEKLQASSKRISVTNNSSWSCSEYSPNGILVNTKTGQTAVWQIEHNGAWHYELTDIGRGELLAIRLSGPEEFDTHWWKLLGTGESFSTVTVAFGQLLGDAEAALDAMTTYRRIIQRPSADNVKLPVIFNDYMNGLAGDPTTDTEIPLIDAAKSVGCEYFVIDCGWYADGYWWDSVGQWQPSKARFPEGIEKLIHYIQDQGMTPGLWLEIEVIGIKSPLADRLPDDWFFMRHGKRVIDADRYHLDFTNPEVTHFADEVVDRLVRQYGVGYIKMDYNITTGIGTDSDADSVGDGLLKHNRAYLQWLDALFARYPDLVIENCGSGGMRHDYAMLQRHSIQSMSDQTDYVRNGNIAAVGASVVAPEQCAIWSYPLQHGDEEEVIFNMVNAMLLRIHQSGLLNKVEGHRRDLVAEGIATYKTYRDKIPGMLPVWPEGLSKLDDPWFSYGLRGDHELYLAIWRGRGGAKEHVLDVSRYGQIADVERLYPKGESATNLHVEGNAIRVQLPHQKMARLLRIRFAS